MKIHILYPFEQGVFGGGNQFLKALRGYFISRQCYEEKADAADAIVFNSYPLAMNRCLEKRYFLRKTTRALSSFTASMDLFPSSAARFRKERSK